MSVTPQMDCCPKHMGDVALPMPLRFRVNPDDQVCLCFHVSLRKIRTYLARENPPVASLISECLSAGTGCQWCVPFLKYLHTCHLEGREPDLRVSPEEYAKARLSYHKTDVRDATVVKQATDAIEKQSGPAADGEPG